MKNINKWMKKRGVIFIVIAIISILFSFVKLYGVEIWDLLRNDVRQVNLDEATLKGVEENEGVYLTTTNDSQLTFSIDEIEGKYIYVNISDILSKPINTVQLYYSTAGEFDEKKSIVQPMKNGNIIFRLPEDNVGICRFDLGDQTGASIKINSIQYSTGILMVPEFIYFVLISFIVLMVVYILYHKRERIKGYVVTHKWEVGIVISAFLVYVLWALLLPFNGGPDEEMRYDIPQYIFKYGNLPRGDEPLLCDNIWGVSYAFDPYLAYLFCVIFMKIANLFGAIGTALFYSARLVNVAISIITLIFVIKISNKIFKGSTARLFVVLIAFLPQFIFITSYINCDAIALLSTAIICYYWIQGTKESWSYKNCIGLAIGLAICLGSYKNAYGYGICSVVVFCIPYIIKCYREKAPKVLVELLKKGFLIGLIVFAISGWWFVRNYILYDGDFFGTETLIKTKLLNATDGFRPENTSLKLNGHTLKEMIFDMGWLKMSIKSFIAGFGFMNIFLREQVYNIYYLIFGVGILGYVFNRKKICNRLVRINLGIAIVIVWILSLVYSYTLDFQPQGRYLMPMLIPLMIFISDGLGYLQQVLVEKTGKNIPLVPGITILYVVCAILILPMLIIPYYYW